MTAPELTAEVVRGLREARRISREDFEAWSYDDEAAARVRSALKHYRCVTMLCGVDDPIGGGS